MPELDIIIKHARKKEHDRNRFTAAMQGIDLDKENQANSKIEDVRRRAASRIMGGNLAVEKAEFADLGFGYEQA